MIQSHWEFGDYADAYRSAARCLTAAAKSEPELNARLFDAHLALPTVYLYRHALELALKDAIIWTEITISQGVTSQFHRSVDDVRRELRGHRLRPLYLQLLGRYQIVDSLTESIKPVGMRQTVEPAVTAAESLDSDGQRLRYPFASDGLERSWSRTRLSPNQIRVDEVSQSIETALEYLLDVLGPWFSENLERSAELAWLAQLRQADQRAAVVESIHVTEVMVGDDDIIEDLKADLSASMLDLDGD